MKRRHLSAFSPLVILLLLITYSCRSSRTVTSGRNELPKSLSAAVDRVDNTYRSWHTVKMPLNVSVSGSQQLTAGGTAVMVRDSLLRMSFRLIGFEVAVIELTRDEALIVDRAHRTYYRQPLTQFISDLPVNLSNLQDLFLGRPLTPGFDGFAPGQVDMKVTDDTATGSFVIFPAKEPYPGFSYKMVFRPGGELSGITITTANGLDPVVEYGLNVDGICATEMNMTTSGQSGIGLRIRWDTPKCEVDNPELKIEPVRIPSTYKSQEVTLFPKLL